MAVEAIWIVYYHGKLRFSNEAMKNMQKLRILCIRSYSEENDGPIEYLPNNLCWFDWWAYPWKLLPQNFNPTRLVHLELQWSSLHQLWNETKQLPSLRRLDLRGSESLKRIPDFSGMPNLEYLDLSGCTSLIELVHHSLGCSRKLTELNLSKCKSLKRTPDFSGMPNLEHLDLSGCTSLEEVHHSLGCSRKLIELNLSKSKSIKRFPYVNVESLEYLDLYCCSSLEKLPEFIGRVKPELKIMMKFTGIREIPSSICKLKCLVKLNVSKCSELETLPEEIGDLENLEELRASRTLVSRPPSSIIRLNKLKVLNFAKYESEGSAVCFVFPQVNEGLLSLEELDLRYCNLIDGGLPEDIGSLSSLKELDLSGNNFEHLPQSIAQLGALRYLSLSGCKKLKELPCFTGMVNLDTLDLRFCNLIDGVLPEDIGSLSSLKKLDLSGNNFEHLPRSIAQLGDLRSLGLFNCNKLKELPCLTGMPNLVTLNLGYCNLIDGGLPEDIGCLSSLEELDLSGNNFEYLPQSISQLSALRSLDLSHCNKITQLPEIPQQLDTIYADWSNDWICNWLFQKITSLQHDISASLRVFTSRWYAIPSWFHHQGKGASVSVNLRENWYVSDNVLGFAVCYFGFLSDNITAHLIPLCDDGTWWMTQKFALSNHSKSDINFFLLPLAGLWDACKAIGTTPNDYGHFMLFSTGEKKAFGVRLLYKDGAELGIRRSRYEEATLFHDWILL